MLIRSDFAGATSGVLTFAANELSKVITLNVVGDTVNEADEAFSVVLSGATGATIASGTASGRIVNDDVVVPAVISIASTLANTVRAEGTNASMPFTFSVTRSNGNGVASVNYSVVGAASSTEGAASASDFINGQIPSGVITFAAGQTTQNITIGVSGDAFAEVNERFSVALSNPTGGTLGTAVSYGVILNDDVSSQTFGNIFRSEGASGGDGSNVGIYDAGRIRVMADFSKAAYSRQTWEVGTVGGLIINDFSEYSRSAYDSIISQGWVPVDLNPVFPSSSFVDGQFVLNRMTGGYFTNGNAAAFIARSGDSLVISFRGTNDNGDNNPSDSGNNIHPDTSDWYNMSRHYNLLRPLIAAVDDYVASNGISNVFVTGHSLGGAMAIKYMGDHQGVGYSAVTFAAPGYADTSFVDRSRVLHIEINGDVVPDLGLHGGRTIHFEGSGTREFVTGADNHSMDYYRQIVDVVDPQSWAALLLRQDDPEVYMGVTKSGTQFLVDGVMSGTGYGVGLQNDNLLEPVNRDYEVFYGGRGNDTIVGGVGADLMLGGAEQDYIVGGFGSDTLTGGAGSDVFRFSLKNEGGDIITDFQSGIDKIQIVSSNFGTMPVGVLGSARFLAGANPTATNSNAVFLYNTSTGVLTFDSNGSGVFGTTTLATLTGSRTLVAGDIQVVAA